MLRYLTSGSSLPRHDNGVLSGGSLLLTSSESHLGKRLGLAEPLSEADDLVPWFVDGERPEGRHLSWIVFGIELIRILLTAGWLSICVGKGHTCSPFFIVRFGCDQ
jgi:hypothetical protein